MVKSVSVIPMSVLTRLPVYRKRIIERWGPQGGDSREYHISLQGDQGSICVSNTRIDFDKEVFLQVAFAMQELHVAQIEAAG